MIMPSLQSGPSPDVYAARWPLSPFSFRRGHGPACFARGHLAARVGFVAGPPWPPPASRPHRPPVVGSALGAAAPLPGAGTSATSAKPMNISFHDCGPQRARALGSGLLGL